MTEMGMKDGYVYLGGPVIFVQDDDGDGDDDHVVQSLLHLILDHHREPGEQFK